MTTQHDPRVSATASTDRHEVVTGWDRRACQDHTAWANEVPDAPASGMAVAIGALVGVLAFVAGCVVGLLEMVRWICAPLK